MMKISNLFLFLVGTLTLVAQQTPTFHLDVAPIIYNNCTECHRVGEIGPMPFTTYDEVANQAGLIHYVIETGYMPPWTPDHNYSSLRGERFLTPDQIQIISDWIDADLPEGDPADNPGLPSFPEGSQIGTPDLVLSMPEPYVHDGDMSEQYQVFVIPTDVDIPQEVQAIEVRPGNAAIAHHALIAYTAQPTDIGTALSLDAADPAPGYESFGDYGVPVEDYLFGGWVPGSPPLEFPPTIGKIIEPEGALLLQMHYGPTPIPESDLTEINIFFADAPVEREVETYTISPDDLDEFFFIPAGTVKTFEAEVDIPSDLSLISITPHCHLLGQQWEVYAVHESDTIPLISIPEWDFNWQGIFTFPSLQMLPAGSTLHAICTYDNTVNNPYNPSNPPANVFWGDLTEDEMFILFLQFVEYMPGDEDVSLSAPNPQFEYVYSDAQLFLPYPNPVAAGQELNLGWMLPKAQWVALDLLDARGRPVVDWGDAQAWPAGIHKGTRMLPADLPVGTYSLVLRTETGVPVMRQLVVQP